MTGMTADEREALHALLALRDAAKADGRESLASIYAEMFDAYMDSRDND